MLIAQEKRKTNIAEYILYMWQVEDLIRAYRFNIDDIEENLISQYPNSEKIRDDVRDWYANLILMMYQEGIRERGHLSFLKTLMDEITDLHIRLINLEGQDDYQQLYRNAQVYLDEFRKKSADPNAGDIETCLNALYGLLLLRLKKQQVSRETEIAMSTFSKLMALLSQIFLKVERGEREI
ncbi:MAG TPA: DUF4924 family protein [Bacteroidales bacterium]|nr:DUF4924 family protein [Bacteroidales bacterium]